MLSSCSEDESMKKLFNFLIALFPILSGYGFSLSLDFGSLLLFIVGAGCVVVYPKKFKIKFPVGYMAFFVVALLLSLLWARSVPLRLLLYSANLCFACCYADLERLWKYYGIIVWISIGYFLIQEASFYTLGFRPGGLIPFLPTIYGGDTSARIAATAIQERSSSFFLEPSYFAQFLIPYVIISLFSSEKKDTNRAIVVSIVLLLVRSGMGIMLLGIIWLIWFMVSKTKTSTKILISLAAVALFGLLIYTNSSILDYFSSRSGELMSYTGDEQYQSSGFIRFFRGYFAFADLAPLSMLLGANPTDVQNILEHSIFFGADSSNFINGMQTLLFYHGVVGTLLYVRHLFLLPYKSKNNTLLVMSIAVLVLLLGESFYLSSRLFVMTVFMFLIREGSTVNKVRLTNKGHRITTEG